jgi:mono/diheme cytochrome c family protein
MKIWLLAVVAAIFPAALEAQGGNGRTTHAGVYSTEQASRGQDVYVAQCRSCHTLDAHSSVTFQSAWTGKSLAELYAYIRERMPKNEPASLSDQEYIDVLAFLLKLNRMPAGPADLPADTAILRDIRFRSTSLPVRKDP